MAVAAPTNIGGFSMIRPPTRYRMIVSISGLDKSGKTNFALTAPGDIAYANFDVGLEGVIHKFEKNKRIYTKDYSYGTVGTDIKEVATAAGKVWDEFKADFRAALRAPSIRTVVIDTEGETYELIRIARFGKLTQVMPHHYGPVKAEYRDVLNEIYDTDKNLILLGRLKDEYKNEAPVAGKAPVGEKTGNLIREGMKDIPYMVQLNAIARCQEGAPPDSMFSIHIVNSRQNHELSGMDIPQPLCTFAAIGQMLYPDSREEDWR